MGAPHVSGMGLCIPYAQGGGGGGGGGLPEGMISGVMYATPTSYIFFTNVEGTNYIETSIGDGTNEMQQAPIYLSAVEKWVYMKPESDTKIFSSKLQDLSDEVEVFDFASWGAGAFVPRHMFLSYPLQTYLVVQSNFDEIEPNGHFCRFLDTDTDSWTGKRISVWAGIGWPTIHDNHPVHATSAPEGVKLASRYNANDFDVGGNYRVYPYAYETDAGTDVQAGHIDEYDRFTYDSITESPGYILESTFGKLADLLHNPVNHDVYVVGVSGITRRINLEALSASAEETLASGLSLYKSMEQNTNQGRQATFDADNDRILYKEKGTAGTIHALDATGLGLTTADHLFTLDIAALSDPPTGSPQVQCFRYNKKGIAEAPPVSVGLSRLLTGLKSWIEVDVGAETVDNQHTLDTYDLVKGGSPSFSTVGGFPAVSFLDATSDELTGDATLYQSVQQSFTVAIQIYNLGDRIGSAVSDTLFSKWGGTLNEYSMYLHTDDKLYFHAQRDVQSTHFTATSAALTTSDLHHAGNPGYDYIVFVVNTANALIFLNAVQIASTTLTGLQATSDSPFRVMRDSIGNTNELSIAKVVLSHRPWIIADCTEFAANDYADL